MYYANNNGALLSVFIVLLLNSGAKQSYVRITLKAAATLYISALTWSLCWAFH